jgi:hypothetical protein
MEGLALKIDCFVRFLESIGERRRVSLQGVSQMNSSLINGGLFKSPDPICGKLGFRIEKKL